MLDVDCLDVVGKRINVKKHLDDWINRRRPLFKTSNKEIKEIWSQMQMYIHENYS